VEYRRLGRTSILVSRLCFGLLTMSRLQLDLDPMAGARLLRKALDVGVNFIDTAVLYDTDDVLREFLSSVTREEVVIASKSYDFEYGAMERTVAEVLSSLRTDYLDLFLLHEQESRLTLRGHVRALDCLQDLKRKGLVRAVGVSTHYVDVVRACALHPSIDVIHPIYNWRGIGILDGTAEDMREAIAYAHEMGKGIYCMKALGGGHLAADLARSLDYVMSCEAVDSVAVGIASEQELELDIAVFEGRPIEDAAVAELAGRKTLHVADWCEGCGKCVARCDHGAVRIVEGKARVDADTCVVCGYCASVCPLFCLKVY
jgi:aryl-alcohol dehydrogenase-like predicted oxidoreductase